MLKRFGPRPVLRGITLDVASGEFLTILGESGSGKTTLLRLIAGFERLDGGEILMDGARLDPIPAHQRQVNTVFQSYAIFPHLSVFENVAYGLRAKNAPKSEIPDRVTQALAMVKMSDFAQSAPSRLSGGQQQRVALARALVNRPRVLLLDEPLSALDANLRRQMQTELKSLQREVGITFIFVTHDQEEAMALSDRVALLRAGHLNRLPAPAKSMASPLPPTPPNSSARPICCAPTCATESPALERLSGAPSALPERSPTLCARSAFAWSPPSMV